MKNNCFYLMLTFITMELYIITTIILFVLFEFNIKDIYSFIIISVIIFTLFSHYIRIISDVSNTIFNLELIKKLTFFWFLFKKETQH